MRILTLFFSLISITSTWAAATHTATNLPEGWAAADLGTVRKPGAVSYDAATKAFTIQSIGEATEQRGTFAFTSVKGDFVAACRVTAASQKSVGAGLIQLRRAALQTGNAAVPLRWDFSDHCATQVSLR